MFAFKISFILAAASLAAAVPFKSHNGGHNVENINDNDLVDAADAVVLADVLDKRVSFRNGGHNVLNSIDSDVVDSKDPLALVDVLKREPSQGKVVRSFGNKNAVLTKRDPSRIYNAGHNIVNNEDSDLIDSKDLVAAVELLKRANFDFTSDSWKRDFGGSNLMLRNYKNEDCVCRAKPSKDSCSGGSGGHKNNFNASPKHTTTHHWNHAPTRTHHATHHAAASPTHHHSNKGNGHGHHSCASGWSYVNGGHNVYNENDSDVLDLKDLTLDISVLSLEGKPSKSTTGRYQDKCHGNYGCCVRKSSNNHGSCKSGYSYVNKGHNVYNKNDNDLVDLKNLTLDIDILSDDGKSTKSSHKGKWDDKCSGSHGCCVKSIKDGGHNVVNKNDQDVVDLKGASVGLHVLSGVTKSLGAALGTQTNGILGTGLHGLHL